jgi:hypothetical protein
MTSALTSAGFELNFYRSINNDRFVKIKEQYVRKAFEIIQCFSDCTKVFVHIRLGDFDNFSVFGKSAKLPISYYHKAIDLIKTKCDNTVFIFCSNEPNEIEKLFTDLENKYISRNSAIIDMAIVNFCDGGVLSASTFSYFGRYYQKLNNNELTIAPRYWFGFNSRIEYPENSFPRFAKMLEVEICDKNK